MKNSLNLLLFVLFAVNMAVTSIFAADQIWDDTDISHIWNLTNTNWDAGSTWVNGNSAVFNGNSSVIELDADIIVGGLTFNTNGYEIADTNADGSFTIAGSPTVITVAGGYNAKLSDSVDGSGGLTKEGLGTLEFTSGNSYTGVTHIKEGILKLANKTPTSLGQGGAGNEAYIEDGAALDLNGAYNAHQNQHIYVSGAGVNGSGAIFTSAAAGNYNFSFGDLTLQTNTTIRVPIRWDLGNNGTVYGNGHTLTKIGGDAIAVSRAVNNCPIIINEGTWTAQNAGALGGTDFDTWINNSSLFIWGNHAFNEHIYFTGNSSLGEGANGATATFTGNLTVSNTLSLSSRLDTNGLDIPAYIDGPGGITKNGPGWCYITCDTNSYAGTTQIDGGRSMWVGLPDGSSTTGRLGPGPIVVQGNLYFDVPNTTTISNVISSWGFVRQRYDNELIFSGCDSSTATPRWTICDGSLTLTNSTHFNLEGRDFTISDRQGGGYPVDPTNVTARLTVTDGCSLTAKSFICGNGGSVTGGGMTSIVNQVGGTITSTGTTAEENGFRMGHYPQANTAWNMSGGTMICQNDYDICMGTDGSGWLNVTGGDIYTTRIMLNERANNGGYGRFTLAGGTLHLGSLTVADPTRNAITTDSIADYTYDLELGGLGAEIIAAVTNIYIPIDATLLGTTCETAVNFNSNGHIIYFSGQFFGTGGFKKTGAGTMEITSSNSPGINDICLMEGTLKLTADDALPNGVIYVAEGATLDLGGHDQIIGGVKGPGAVVNGTYTATRYFEPGTVIILY